LQIARPTSVIVRMKLTMKSDWTCYRVFFSTASV